MPGLLDQPLIADMDAIEKKARKGDEAALKLVFDTLPPLQQNAIRRFMAREKLPIRDAFAKAGVIICIR